MANHLTLVDFIIGEKPIMEVKRGDRWLYEALMPLLYPGNGEQIGKELRTKLERLINESFLERGMRLTPEYFELPQWKSYGNYMVLGVDASDPKQVKIGGGLIAFKDYFDGSNFMLYDKIFVHPNYRGNQTYKSLIQRARIIDRDRTKKINPQDSQHPLAAGLRTKDGGLDQQYLEVSQDRIHVPPYFVHLFGTRDYNGREIFDLHRTKSRLCEHIAGRTPTFYDIL